MKRSGEKSAIEMLDEATAEFIVRHKKGIWERLLHECGSEECRITRAIESNSLALLMSE